MRLDFDVRPLNPPAPMLQVFNFTLRSNDVRLNFNVRSSNPPAPMLQVFNFTLRSNDVRLNFDVRSLNPPAPMLQATVLDKLKPVAHNVTERFLLGRFP